MAKAARSLSDGEMSGLHKASILMLALGEEHTGKLFAMMHEDEIRAISATMAQLGAVPADAVESLCVDFVKNFGAAGGILGSFESTEGLMLKALPRDRVSQIMEEIRGPAGRTMWDKLVHLVGSGDSGSASGGEVSLVCNNRATIAQRSGSGSDRIESGASQIWQGGGLPSTICWSPCRPCLACLPSRSS